MKLVIGIVRPERANEVLEALYRADIRGYSISRVQGHGGELDRVETYRGHHREDAARRRRSASRSRCRRSSCKPTIDALREGARTGEVGDGKIFVLDLDAGRAHPHRRDGRRARSRR